ncbi:MAG: hypothetical protein IKZ88_08670 [Neisseriaceae bacterium]|nr:hypothetical protein [Neisseriaceae bacterium]
MRFSLYKTKSQKTFRLPEKSFVIEPCVIYCRHLDGNKLMGANTPKPR